MDNIDKDFQRYLTIVDTINDFGSSSRSNYDQIERKELKNHIMFSLFDKIGDNLYNLPRNDINNRYLKPCYDKLMKAFRPPLGSNARKEFHRPSDVENNTDEKFKQYLRENGNDYITKGNYYQTIENMTEFDLDSDLVPDKGWLFRELKDLTQGKMIKYVLDKNIAKKKIFCNSTFQYRDSMYINANTQNKNNNSNVFKDDDDCFHKDIVEYKITKDDGETFILDELGVKKEGQSYKLYYSCNGSNHISINFDVNIKAQQLTLFLKAAEELDKIETLEAESLKVLDSMFKIRCLKYNKYNTASTSEEYVILNEEEFLRVLFDLKRCMDYLPVKAALNANKKLNVKNIIYFFVSSDRLAIIYALLQKCPCIYVPDNANIFHVYNYNSNLSMEQTGGLKVSPQSTKITNKKSRSKEKFYFENFKISTLIGDIDDKNKSAFEEFMLNYQKKFNVDYLNYFWFIIYRFIFMLIE